MEKNELYAVIKYVCTKEKIYKDMVSVPADDAVMKPGFTTPIPSRS